jgi:hypothetical protein
MLASQTAREEVVVLLWSLNSTRGWGADVLLWQEWAVYNVVEVRYRGSNGQSFAEENRRDRPSPPLGDAATNVR